MPRILVIDDDEHLQDILEQTFTRAGYDSVTAADGSIGVKLYRDKPFDVVITDLILPEMDGFETISNLQKIDPEVKVIAITGGGHIEPNQYLKIALDLGVASTFAKPFNRNKLLETVDDLLRH